MEYIQRNLFEEIKKWIERREILIIKGPRQAGKTTLLEMLKNWLMNNGVNSENIIFVTFEDIELRENFSANPKDFVKRFAVNENERYYFLIDEAHYCPDVGQKLKLLYDLNKNIKFIATGSSSLEITSETAKFLVGRMFSFELLPFNFHEYLSHKDENLSRIYLEGNKKVRDFLFFDNDLEIKETKEDIFIRELQKHLEEYLIFGGYPEVVKAKTDEEKNIILKNIFNTYLIKDVVSYLNITDTAKFRKLISMMSFSIGNLISYENLSRNCGSYFKEILKLIDILEQTYIVTLLRPFHKSMITELKKNPKVYFIDSGLRNYALNNFNSLDLRADAGALAENFVFNQINQIKGDYPLNFWRTTAKAEVDFVLNVNGFIPIEVKFEAMKKPKITRSFRSFIENYKPKKALIVTKNLWASETIQETKVKFIPITYL
ncbi:MAG: hypothetical protein A7315_13295 [Candidatus Altiarchaeales archaeon WOR_SM1_79]|nr:MAG: hypothetical protein A7315_13295 [Candidatus Altiarchaeales archaeon WOR_SM1_79]